MSGNETYQAIALNNGGVSIALTGSDEPLVQVQAAATRGGFPVTMVSIGGDDAEGETDTMFIVRGPGWRRVIQGYLWDTTDIPGPDGTTVPCLAWLEEGDRLHVRCGEETGWRYTSLDVPNGTNIYGLSIIPGIGQVAVVGRMPNMGSLTLWLCGIGSMKVFVGEKIHQQDADAYLQAGDRTKATLQGGLLTLTLAEQTLEVQMRPWEPRRRS